MVVVSWMIICWITSSSSTILIIVIVNRLTVWWIHHLLWSTVLLGVVVLVRVILGSLLNLSWFLIGFLVRWWILRLFNIIFGVLLLIFLFAMLLRLIKFLTFIILRIFARLLVSILRRIITPFTFLILQQITTFPLIFRFILRSWRVSLLFFIIGAISVVVLGLLVGWKTSLILLIWNSSWLVRQPIFLGLRFRRAIIKFYIFSWLWHLILKVLSFSLCSSKSSFCRLMLIMMIFTLLLRLLLLLLVVVVVVTFLLLALLMIIVIFTLLVVMFLFFFQFFFRLLTLFLASLIVSICFINRVNKRRYMFFFLCSIPQIIFQLGQFISTLFVIDMSSLVVFLLVISC